MTAIRREADAPFNRMSFGVEARGSSFRVVKPGTKESLTVVEFTHFEYLWRDRKGKLPEQILLGISGPYKRLLHPDKDDEGNSFFAASNPYTEISVERGKIMGTLGNRKEEVNFTPRAQRKD